MSEGTLQALRGRINARLQTSAISRDRASAAGREVVAQCRQSDVETLEWVLSEIDAALATAEPSGEAGGDSTDCPTCGDELAVYWEEGRIRGVVSLDQPARAALLRTPRGEGKAVRLLGLAMERAELLCRDAGRAEWPLSDFGRDMLQARLDTVRDLIGDALAALRPEAQGEEDAVRRAWELAVQRAYGCLDYCGGYRGAELKAFHSGIKTVIRALEAGLDTVDTQTAALDRIGATLRTEAQGEGWQVTEPARDIVRREMPETRATVREAIRAARRGEGGGE